MWVKVPVKTAPAKAAQPKAKIDSDDDEDESDDERVCGVFCILQQYLWLKVFFAVDSVVFQWGLIVL